MAPSTIPWRVMVTVCWLAAAAVAAPPYIKDMFKMTVFSSLQQDRMVFDTLSPYPEGANLTLTCNMRVAKPQWWELDEILCPKSEENSDTGIHSIKFTISTLTARDHGRRLTCASENGAVTPVTVAIYVISAMPELQISYSTSDVSTTVVNPTAIPLGQQTTRLMCEARGLDRHLQLCWFKNETKLGCQTGGESLTVPQQSLTQEDAGTKLICKPQMRHWDLLVPKVQCMFENMFQSAQREVQMTFTDNDPEAANLPVSTDSPQQDDGPNMKSVNQPCVGPCACDASCLMVDIVSRVAEDDQLGGEGKVFLLSTIRPGPTGERHTQNVCNSDQDKVEPALTELPVQADGSLYSTEVEIVLTTLLVMFVIAVIVLCYKWHTRKSDSEEQHTSQTEENESEDKKNLVIGEEGKGAE